MNTHTHAQLGSLRRQRAAPIRDRGVRGDQRACGRLMHDGCRNGDQAGWLLAVMAHYAASPQLEAVDQVPVFTRVAPCGSRFFRLKSGVKPAELRARALTVMAAQAEKSYGEFKRFAQGG